MERGDLYPYLVVNIGSGVSIVKVDGPTAFTRVSGTALGPSTTTQQQHTRSFF